MDETQGGRHWCHQCEEVIDPVMEPEMKCPSCGGGFVEEMEGGRFEPTANLRSDRSLSLWAPLLLGMMGGSSRSRRSRSRREFRDEDEDDDDSDHELEDLIRRRRRSSSIVRMLQSIRDDIRFDLDDLDRDWMRDRERERERRERERERERDRERERGRERTESLILINSNNEAIILQGTFGPDDSQDESSNSSSGVSLGDYFLGPGLDLLLQRLADSDLNRYGTPPAKKEAVDALPTVKIQEMLSCSVCLEDFEMGVEVKQMPCQHKFHCNCILPWLELHSSCPICRFQLPSDESKDSHESANGGGAENGDVDGGAMAGGNRGSANRGGSNRSGGPLSWPLSMLFSSSDSRSNESSSNPSASSSSSPSGNNSHASKN